MNAGEVAAELLKTPNARVMVYDAGRWKEVERISQNTRSYVSVELHVDPVGSPPPEKGKES